MVEAGIAQVIGVISPLRQIGTQYLFDVLAGVQPAEIIQIGRTFNGQDTFDVALGMLHFVNRLEVFLVVKAY